MNKVYVLGNGGHANSVIEVIRSLGPDNIVQLPYDDVLSDKSVEIDSLDRNYDVHHAIAIGDITFRKVVASSAFCQRTTPYRLLSLSAYIAIGAKIGRGTVVMPGATIRSHAVIGDYSIINTGSVIEHNCTVGSFVNVSPGAILCGRVSIADSCFVGAGSVIIDKVSICSGVVVGAGAVVLKDIHEPGTYLGVPARRV